MKSIWIAIASLLCLFSGPLATDAQTLSKADAACRRGLMLAERRLTFHLVRQMGQCHVQRARGRIRSDVDCNDPANVPFPQAIARIERSVAQLARSQCRDAGSPATLGFDACPAPCPATQLVQYVRDVAPCLVCRARAEASDTMEMTLGEPPVTGPHTRETLCVEAVATGMRKSVNKRLEQQRYCQFLQDRGRVGGSIDCRNADLKGHLARSRGLVRYYLARCKADSRSRVLDCGAGDIETTVQCVEAALESGTNGLFDTVYPD